MKWVKRSWLIAMPAMSHASGWNVTMPRDFGSSHFPDDEARDDSRNHRSSQKVGLLVIQPPGTAASLRIFYWNISFSLYFCANCVPPRYLMYLNSRTHNKPSWHWFCCTKVRSIVKFTLQTILYQLSKRVNFHMHLLLAAIITKLQLCKWWQTLTSLSSQLNLYFPFAFNLTFNIRKAQLRYCTTRTMSHNMVG